jgi:hypothetical protein
VRRPGLAGLAGLAVAGPQYQKIEGFLRPFYRKTPDKSSYRHIIGVVFAGLDAITGYNLRENIGSNAERLR